MEEKKRPKAFWIVLAVLGLVLSIGFGALVGGAAGYWLGRRAGVRVEREVWPIPSWPTRPRWPWRIRPLPRSQSVSGAVVTSVSKGSPADTAGIRVGDVITAVDGESVGKENTLQDLIRKHKPGDSVEITVQRRGAERTLKVKLGSQSEQPDVAYLGVTYVSSPS
jgi:membrane-associated protease RseP (regulator of RpoE activity)